MNYVERDCNSILVKSKLPDATYVVNPYTGCEFGCSYCYASFMGRFVGEPIESWGNYVMVKRNAVDVFKKDLARLSSAARRGTILLSSVTDAWQPAERRYRLSRGILEELVSTQYPGVVSVLTKSPIVLDDLALIRGLVASDIGVTITTTDDAIGRLLEVRAPSSTRRIKTLAALSAGGVQAYAFIGPLLPHYCEQPDALKELFARVRDTGTSELYVELINTSKYIRKRLDDVVLRGNEAIVTAYGHADDDIQRSKLAGMVMDLVDQFGFHLRLGRVIDHRKDAKCRV